jgi:hypothetical protein
MNVCAGRGGEESRMGAGKILAARNPCMHSSRRVVKTTRGQPRAQLGSKRVMLREWFEFLLPWLILRILQQRAHELAVKTKPNAKRSHAGSPPAVVAPVVSPTNISSRFGRKNGEISHRQISSHHQRCRRTGPSGTPRSCSDSDGSSSCHEGTLFLYTSTRLIATTIFNIKLFFCILAGAYCHENESEECSAGPRRHT